MILHHVCNFSIGNKVEEIAGSLQRKGLKSVPNTTEGANPPVCLATKTQWCIADHLFDSIGSAASHPFAYAWICFSTAVTCIYLLRDSGTPS